MRWLFLESVPALLVTVVAIQFLLVCIWSWSRRPAAARMVWFGFAAIPVLLVISKLVVTSREQIAGVCDEIANRVELADVDGVGRYLDANLSAADFDREQLLHELERVLRTYRVSNATISGLELVAVQPAHVVEFAASCDLASRDGDLGRLPTRWRVTFRRAPDRWTITSIETLPVPPLNAKNLRQLLD